MPERFSAARAVELSGFDGSYARVLFLDETDGLAIAVIDSNDDGREIEANLYELGPDGRWRESVSGMGSGATDELVWQCGYAPSRTSVQVMYAAETHEVPVTAETGMWYFVGRRAPNDHRAEGLLPEGPPNESWT